MAVEIGPMQDHFDVPQNPGPEADRPLVEAIDLKRLFLTIDGLAARQAAVDHFLETGSNHVSVAGAIGDYEAMFDPLNNQGTPAQKDAVINVESQILRMNALKGTRGRNDFTDKRNIDRLERARNWMEVDARTTLIAVPKGNVPQLESIPEEQPFSGTEGAKPLINSKPIEHAGRVALAAGVIAMPTTNLDSSPLDDTHRTTQAETRSSDQHVITISKSELNAQLMGILTAGFNEGSLKVGDNGVVTQRVSLGGVDYDVALTAADIQKLHAMQKGLQNEDGGEKRFKVYLASLGKAMRMPVEPTDGPPPSKTPTTEKPTATAKPTEVKPTNTPVATQPNPTSTPGSTQEPPVTVTLEPTESPTPTEKSHEKVGVPQGAQVMVADGETSAGDMSYFTNGDSSSAAKDLGFDIPEIEQPVLDEDMVVGSAYLPGGDIAEAKALSQQRVTVIIPADNMNPNDLDGIPQADTVNDERFHTVYYVWKGDNGSRKVNASAAGTDGLPEAKLKISPKGKTVEFRGYAQGNADSGEVSIYNYDPKTKKGSKLIMRYDIKKRLWGLYSQQANYIENNFDQETNQTKNPQFIDVDSEQLIYNYPPGKGELQYTFGDNSIIIPGVGSFPTLAFNYPNISFGAGRKGAPRSTATILISNFQINISDNIDTIPEKTVEAQLPSISELASSAGFNILIDSTYLGTDAKRIAAYKKIGLTILSNYSAESDAQEELFEDKDEESALVIGAADEYGDVAKKMDKYTDRTYVLVPRESGSGPIGAVFTPEGKLLDRKKLLDIIEKARSTRNKIVINSGIPLHLDTSGIQTTRMSPMEMAISEIAALGSDLPVILAFNADQQNYRKTKVTKSERAFAMSLALKKAKDAGLKTGVIDAMADKDDQEWYSDIAKSIIASKADMLGIGSLTLRYLDPDGALTFLTVPDSNDDQLTYSVGALKLRDELIKKVTQP